MNAIAPRRRKSRRHAVVTGALAAGLILSGCSPFAGGGGRDANTLTVSTFDAIDAEILKEVGKEFTKQNPGMKVQVTQIPEESYVTKIQTAVVANDPPDVAYMYSVGTTGLFQPLDELLYEEHDLDPVDYNLATLEYACGRDGKIYCAGGYHGALALYYNKKIFEEKGVPALDPSTAITFDEYAEIARKVAEPNDDPNKAVWAGDPWAPGYNMDPATFISDDGRSTELDSAEYVNAFQNVCELNREGISPSEGQMESLVGEEGSSALFAKGQLAMTIGDPTMIDMLAAAGFSEEDYGVAPTPVPAGEEAFPSVWTNGYGIPIGSRNAEKGAEFLALWATYGQDAHAKRNLMPLLASAAEDQFASKGPRHAELFGVSQLARSSVFTPNLFSWLGVTQDAMDECVQQGTEPATLLADADSKAQQGLDVSWEQFEKERVKTKG